MAHQSFGESEKDELKKLLKKWAKRIGVLVAGALFGGGAVEVSNNGMPENFFAATEVEPAEEWAQPQAIIEGPNEADPGRLIVLSASESIGDSVQWDPINLPNPTDYKICGRDLICTIDRAGVYEFRLWASNCKDGKPIFSKATHSIRIGGTIPQPPKPDEPSEPDKPSEPNKPAKPKPGKYGLAEFAMKQAGKVSRSERGRADEVAEIFEIGANGNHTSTQAIVSDTLEALRSTLGKDVEAWRDWYAALAERLDELEASGNMITPDEFREAWAEVANGLNSLD